jgi:hypothetical protein
VEFQQQFFPTQLVLQAGYKASSQKGSRIIAKENQLKLIQFHSDKKNTKLIQLIEPHKEQNVS